MRPRLVDVVEEMSLETSVADHIKYQFLVHYQDQELTDLVAVFLEGIGSRHQVPGKVVWKLQDIADQFQQQGSISREQRWLVFNSIVENWHQINIEQRVRLHL